MSVETAPTPKESERANAAYRGICRKHAIVCLDLSTGLHACRVCGRRWWTNGPLRWSRRPRGWWHCPYFGCNVPD